MMRMKTPRTTKYATRTFRCKYANVSGDEHRKDKGDGCKQHIDQREYLTKMYNEESGKDDRQTLSFLKSNLPST